MVSEWPCFSAADDQDLLEIRDAYEDVSSGISSSLRFEFRHRSEFAFRCKHCNYLELDSFYNSFVQIPAFIPSNWKLEIQMAALAMDWPSFSNLAILL